jgi:hypothetical protein
MAAAEPVLHTGTGKGTDKLWWCDLTHDILFFSVPNMSTLRDRQAHAIKAMLSFSTSSVGEAHAETAEWKVLVYDKQGQDTLAPGEDTAVFTFYQLFPVY